MEEIPTQPFLSFQNIWEDNDMIEMLIRAFDGKNAFEVKVYAGREHVKESARSLESFKNQLHGGLLDLSFGSFGPEYANGAFHGRFHFAANQRGRILISLGMQSDFFEFGQKRVASETELYLVSEPGLLDDFIRAFSHIDEGRNAEARLECVDFP